jgi:hypothetical protein
MIDSKEKTSRLDLSVNNRDVTIGDFQEWQQVDISDIAAWPKFDPLANGQAGGASDAGKFIHEAGENFEGSPKKRNYHTAHGLAIMQYENKVNGSTRGQDLGGYQRGVIVEQFKLKNGTVVKYGISNGSNGAIVVTPINK